MDNKSLKYSKSATKVGFANVENSNFSDDPNMTPEEQKNTIFSMANSCRDWYKPEFANEHKYLHVPANINTSAVWAVDPSLEKEQSGIQCNKGYSCFVKGLLVGLGIAVVIKILS